MPGSAEHRLKSVPPCRSLDDGRATAPRTRQYGTHARGKTPRLDGLHDVVVYAGFKRLCFLLNAFLGGEHEHSNVTSCFSAAKHFHHGHAIHSRHIAVCDNHLRAVAAGGIPSGASLFCGEGLEALPFQKKLYYGSGGW